jgi:mannose-6-phosphate isomerase-like protein (cupin superfamily)
MWHRPFALFELADLKAAQARGTDPYYEFLRVPTLNCGLYVLPAGATDRQTPHPEDEVYFVLEGLGVFSVEGADRTVQAGSILYVKAGVEHRFHSIAQDLVVLVFFSSARPPHR